jgi:curved DNA-binding protein CbpA
MLQPKPAPLAEPAATGSLEKKPLAHLLIYALDRKLTGTFEFGDEEGACVHVVVANGMVSRVATSESITYLGHVLYENGDIDAEELSSSLAEVAATKRLHGQVLLTKGKISEAQLAEGLRQQRSRKLQHAFSLSARTTFAFYSDVDFVGERPNDIEPMDPLTCIWRGVRQHPSWDHVRSTIARVGGRPLKLVESVALARLGLDEDEQAAAECLRMKASTIPELAIIGGLSIQATDLLAYFLVITKQAEISERIGASSPPRDAVQPVRATTPGIPFNSGEYARKISFTMRAVTPDSETIRIPSPVPNRFPSPVPGRTQSPTPARLSPSSIPVTRRVSSIPPQSQSARGGSGVPAGLPGSVAPPPPIRPTSSTPPKRTSSGSIPAASDLARKRSIVDRAKWIDQEDYYKMLMVSRDATTEDVRDAFLRAAKVWHPDTLPASISEARLDSEKVFARITHAYETLVAPDKRQAYERSLDEKLKESAEADHFLSQAEMHLTLGDRREAEALVRKALGAAPGFPEAIALLAHLEATDSRKATRDHLRNCLKMVDLAISKDPMCRRAHFYRAEMEKKLDDHEGAIRDLRAAVANDPDDVEAQRELRVYETKIRDGSIQIRSMSPSGGTKKAEGFFDRLLKK